MKLDKMFAEGKIQRDTDAASVYCLDPEFSKFTKDVFRVHFKATRMKNGFERKNISLLYASLMFLYIFIFLNYSQANL